jgi:photosystem II stability/assembly factor-like uncharacterized protein
MEVFDKKCFSTIFIIWLPIYLLLLSFPASILSQVNWEILYQNNFDSEQTTNWFLSAAWNLEDIESGNYALVGRGINDVAPVKYLDGYAWTNYSLKCKLKIQIEPAYIGMRISSYGDSRYLINLSTVGIYLNALTSAGEFRYLAKRDGDFINLDTWHNIEILCQGTQITIYVDDCLIFEFEDDQPLLSGTIAFETWGDCQFQVDDVMVIGELPPHAPPEYTWNATGGPSGGLGYDIRIHPSDKSIMFVTDNPSGINKSYDGGNSWVQRNDGITARSGPALDAIPIFSLTIDSNNPKIVWSGLQYLKGVYRSEDGGETWEQKLIGITEGTDISFRGFAIHPDSSNIVLLAAGITAAANKHKGKIYKTRNNGEIWYPVWEGDNVARVLIFDPTDPNIVYCSTGIFDFDAFNSDKNLGLAGAGGEGILKSLDGGETWYRINNGMDNLYIGFLEMHPDNPEILYAAAGNLSFQTPHFGGVYKTTNGGMKWDKVLKTNMITVVSLSPSNPNIVYAGTDNEFFRSDNNGESWQKLTNESQWWGPPGIVAGFPISAVVDPDDPMKIFVNNYNGGNFMSTNGGKSWVTANDGYSGAVIRHIELVKEEPTSVYCTASSGIFRSINGGDTWDGLAFVTDPYPDFGISINPLNKNEILAGEERNGVIYKSENGGFNWKKVFNHPEASADDSEKEMGFKTIVYAKSDPNIVYAGMYAGRGPDNRFVVSYGIYKSMDGGESWEQKMNGFDSYDKNINCIMVHALNSDIVYAGTNLDGIYKSVDGGNTWNAYNNGLRSMNVQSLAFDTSDPGILYAGLGEGVGIFKSTNGGILWEEINNGINIICPSYISPIGKIPIGITSENANIKFNSNLNYNDIPWTSILDIAIDPTNPDIIYIVDKSTGVYVSFNGGGEWYQISKGLLTKSITCIDISGNGEVVYVGTNGRGVYKLVLGKNKVPQITSYFPTNNDTIVVFEEEQKEFSINAFDLNGDQLIYSWSLNGNIIPTATNSIYILESIVLKEGLNYLSTTVSDQSDSICVTWKICYKLNNPPLIHNLLELTFNEDDSLIVPIFFWYDYIDDEQYADSLLAIKFDPGEFVDVNLHNDSCKFTPLSDWFGTDTLQIIVTDKSNLSSTARLFVVVNPINDPPYLKNLPDSIFFRNDEKFILDISEKVIDVDTPDSSLNYLFDCSNDSLICSVDSINFEIMTISALSGLRGSANLFITVFDDSCDSTIATVPVRVEYPMGVNHFKEQTPTQYELYQNFPNPFNPRTTVRYSLPKPSKVIIEIYNLGGGLVATIFNDNKSAGNHTVIWDAWQNSSGTYFIKMKAGDFVKIRKCVLLK